MDQGEPLYQILKEMDLGCDFSVLEAISRQSKNISWVHKNSFIPTVIEYSDELWKGITCGPQDPDSKDAHLESLSGTFISAVIKRTHTTNLSRTKEKLRIRSTNSEDEFTLDAKNLGTPISTGKSNTRFGPFFYGTFEIETAEAETNPSSGYVLGKWTSSRKLNLLDLYSTPDMPSIFDGRNNQKRESIEILQWIPKALSQPGEHNYIVCQYLIQKLKEHSIHKPIKIDGIIYRSSKYNEGKCLLLFAKNSQCCDRHQTIKGEDFYLKLKSATYISQP